MSRKTNVPLLSKPIVEGGRGLGKEGEELVFYKIHHHYYFSRKCRCFHSGVSGPAHPHLTIHPL